MKPAARLVVLLLLGLAVSAISVSRDGHPSVSSGDVVAQQQDDCEKAHPWQHKVDGECVDKPGVTHYHGNHSPEPQEECWIECLCRQGELPSGNSCAPCSYVGTVCIRH
jgi:hypothetical protein